MPSATISVVTPDAIGREPRDQRDHRTDTEEEQPVRPGAAAVERQESGEERRGEEAEQGERRELDRDLAPAARSARTRPARTSRQHDLEHDEPHRDLRDLAVAELRSLVGVDQPASRASAQSPPVRPNVIGRPSIRAGGSIPSWSRIVGPMSTIETTPEWRVQLETASPGFTPGAAQARHGEPARATALRRRDDHHRVGAASTCCISWPTSVVELRQHLLLHHRARTRREERRRTTAAEEVAVLDHDDRATAATRSFHTRSNAASTRCGIEAQPERRVRIALEQRRADIAGGHDSVLVGERERRPAPVVGVGRRASASCRRCRSRRAARRPPRACRRAALTRRRTGARCCATTISCWARHTIDDVGNRARGRRRCGAPSPRAPCSGRTARRARGTRRRRRGGRPIGAGADRHVAVGERRHPAARRAPTGRRPRSSRRAAARFGSCARSRSSQEIAGSEITSTRRTPGCVVFGDRQRRGRRDGRGASSPARS